MTGLEQTFYIMGIVYMSIMFLVMIAVVIAIFAIKAKINAIEQQIADKLHTVANVIRVGQDIIDKVKKVTGKA